jgi:predicted outer membrane protein
MGSAGTCTIQLHRLQEGRMRTTSTRAFGLVLTSAALAVGTAACGRSDDRGTATDRDGTVDSAAARNANPMTQDTAGDQSIAAVLATIDRSEIQSSRVALQKASAGSVKEYARMMIDEHLRTSQQLAQIARNGNFTVPDSSMLDRDLGFTTTMGNAQGEGSAGAMAGTTGAQTGTGTGSTGGAPGSSGSTSGGSTAGGGGNVGMPSNPQQGSGMAGAGTGQPTSAAMGADSAGARMRGNATIAPEALLREMHQDAQAAMARLRPLRGRDFDKAYMDAQVAMHTKSLNALGNLSASARSTELRAHIDMVSRHVQEHLQRAQTITQGLGGGAR